MDSKKYYISYIKGFLINSLLESKTPLIIALSITMGIVLFNYIVYISMLVFSNINSTHDNEGALSVGFITVIIVLIISTFLATSNKDIGRRFVFPINRKIYAIGNFLASIVVSICFLAGVSMISFLELIVGKLLELISPQFIIINRITLVNYGIGLWLAFCYFVFAMSAAYLVAMYFHRYKLITAVVIGLLIFSMFSLGFVRNIFFELYTFIFLEQSVDMLSMKLGGLTLLCHVLAYIPLKRMEVIR